MKTTVLLRFLLLIPFLIFNGLHTTELTATNLTIGLNFVRLEVGGEMQT